MASLSRHVWIVGLCVALREAAQSVPRMAAGLLKSLYTAVLPKNAGNRVDITLDYQRVASYHMVAVSVSDILECTSARGYPKRSKPF